MKRIMLLNIIICLLFSTSVDKVIAKGFTPSSTNSGFTSVSGDTYTLNCDSITATFKILDVLDNNESKGDCEPNAGVFWNALESKRVADLTKAESEADGENHFIRWAHSVTYGTTNKVTVSINIAEGSSCTGTIYVGRGSGAEEYVDDNSSVKFDLKIESAKTEKEHDFETIVSFEVVRYMGDGNLFNDIKQGSYIGYYQTKYFGTTEKAAQAMTEFSKTGSEEAKKTAEEELQQNETISGSYSEGSGSYVIPDATTIQNVSVGQSQKLTCSTSLRDFIDKIWKYVMIITPILLMVMITMDFFKALFSSEQDLIQKAGQNAVKRTLAAIILLALPLLLSTILGFFGLELCI